MAAELKGTHAYAPPFATPEDCLAANHAERPTAQELPRLRPRRRPALVGALVAASC
ncbi:hypothetical protein [Streptomyces caeruleatus]|uniref:hypothetical protein n=1 Tax=Streptomyces caeruleatus TaxID=661399 RepID=UPI000A97AC8E|nr:hypothetical protein [Streptomyces caeruleatus]